MEATLLSSQRFHPQLFPTLRGSVSWGPYLLAVLDVFTIVTMRAVVVTEGCRKIKLQYYGFKLVSAASLLGSPFWEHVKEILNPGNSVGAGPWSMLRRY
ncbi:unnamed protein product [Prunus armeniaca]|uniref:Uncharacterized protein n=1 Tax=Prunus armeniaca TaxID=36596 RepID=A0A6J5VS21_PRUAR|nr:unnamed protein product [Prunus armeniaca]CAB4322031.1 unnamed protein product [Prunus armeniaca]